MLLKRQGKKSDRLLMGLVVLLSFLGLFAVFNSSFVIALRDFGDKYYFLRLQALWLMAGLFFMLLVGFIPSKIFLKASPLLLVISLISLGAVFIPGLGIKAQGAKRWLDLGLFSFQPAEVAKLTFVLYTASFLSKKKDVVRFLIVLMVLVGLVVLQPDLGTAMIIGLTGLCLYYAAGGSFLELLALAIVQFGGAVFSIVISEYRKARLVSLFDPLFEPLGASYQIRQILIAIGSGGLWGVGLGQSRQKYEYLPETATDSIFAIIAEEVGFVGSLVLIILLGFLIYRIFKVAMACPDKANRLLAIGIGSWLGTQTLINLSAMVALIPLTGVTLPFVSYGGSSLIINLIAIGIVLNISRSTIVKKT